MSERRERSFLRRPRESRSTGDDSPEGQRGPEAAPPPADAPEAPGPLRSGGQLRRSMAVAAERVDEILTSAHEMADEIRREAEAEADRYLELRRKETDLVAEERLFDVRRALNSLRLQIDEVERRMIGEVREHVSETPSGPEVAAPEPAAADPPPGPTPVPSPSAYPGTRAASESDPTARWSEERATALIRASQLAVQGEDREQIALVLRSELGIEQPDEIIDEIMPRRW